MCRDEGSLRGVELLGVVWEWEGVWMEQGHVVSQLSWGRIDRETERGVKSHLQLRAH